MVRCAPRRPSRLVKKAIPGGRVFDLKLFLDSAGVGKKIETFGAKQTVFSQGSPAKSVLYIQEGGVKLTVVNEAGKEAVVAILGLGDFLGEVAPGAQVIGTGDTYGAHDRQDGFAADFLVLRVMATTTRQLTLLSCWGFELQQFA